MGRAIRWTPRASKRLNQIHSHIAKDAENQAGLFIKKIIVEVEDIPDFPNSGRIVPEYQRDDLREKLLGNYRIVYRIQKCEIQVVTVIHGSKLLRNI